MTSTLPLSPHWAENPIRIAPPVNDSHRSDVVYCRYCQWVIIAPAYPLYRDLQYCAVTIRALQLHMRLTLGPSFTTFLISMR